MPRNLLEDDYLNSALLAAVESGSSSVTNKLIFHGATNVDEALAKSRKLKQHEVTAALLIIKAAMENDRILVMKLYGENVQGETKIPLTEEDNLAELQAAVASKNIKTVIPIEISQRNNALAVIEELLLQTDVDKDSGVVLWHSLCLTQLEISWLKKISWVKRFRLVRNKLKSLPPGMGNYLQQCTSLDLQWNRLREIPQCLLELPSIIELNLSHNDLSAIPSVPEWSASLSFLDLSYNRLSDLPKSTVAPTLKNLNISNNRFCSVPHCVCFFIGLTALNVANNSGIVALPFKLGKLKNLLDLNLDGLNSLNDPPKSVCATTADCMQYLRSRLCRPRAYYRMKMMIVGKREMGKSTLVARLHNKKVTNQSTVGVDISEWRYAPAAPAAPANKKNFYFSIWDFTGQGEYYVTHPCFLSKRSLYLVVWKVTEGITGVTDLKPWLDSISARAPDSYVIIVGTFLDKVSSDNRQSGELDDLLEKVKKLTRQYHRLVVTNITVVGLKGQIENVDKLKDYIYNAAAEYKVSNQYVMGKKIPSSYHVLDDKLSTIHLLVKMGTKQKPIMHSAEVKKMIKDLNLVDIMDDDDELHKVTHFLHEVGALLHYDDRKHNLDDLYFVDPCWLCNLVSTVVTVINQNPCVEQGILKNKNIPLLFRDKHFPSKYLHQYLTLLNKFEIALPLDKDYKRVLIPFMLPEKCPNVVAQQHPEYKSCYQRFVLFRTSTYQDQQTPPGFWSRLLSYIMNTIKEIKDVINEQAPVEEKDLFISTDIMNTIKEIKDVINEQAPVEEKDLFISTDVPLEKSFASETSSEMSVYSTSIEGSLENSMASETSSVMSKATCSNDLESAISETSSEMSVYSTSIEGPLENSMVSETSSVLSKATCSNDLESAISSLTASESNRLSQEESCEGSIEVFPIEEGGNLVYWCTGLVYSVNKLAFGIESLAKKYHDKDGVLILASQEAKGWKMLIQLTDIVEKFISEYYPGLKSELEQRVPCPECLKRVKIDVPNPYEFKIDQLMTLIANNKFTHMCGANHKVQLIEIVPDILLADFDSAFLLDYKEIIYKQDTESLLATGSFGNSYHGKYKGREVAVKVYTAKQSSKVEESFKELHSESKILQKLHHPCLVPMIGITIYPTMSLVLEAAPEGSLQALLLGEQRAISRIVLYRIAIQVVSALRFLLGFNIIFRDLKADNVMLWSLSPDHLINCKVNIAIGTGGIRDLHDTKEFVSSEVCHICDASEHSVYDNRADIFSFSMFLYQLLARRHPFHNSKSVNTEVVIEEGVRPQLEDVSIAEIGLYYMTRIMKLCWAGNPIERPACQQIIEWLSASALQLIISVIPVNSKYSIRNGCIVTPDMSNEVGLPPTSSELWICCDGVGGGEVSSFTTNTMVEVRRHSVKENQMHSIKQCGQYVWVPSRIDLEYGVVNIFNKTTKDLVHSLKMRENTVSCITSSDDSVYLGTMEGNCFVFPINVADIQPNTRSRCVCISEHCVDGLTVSETCLWVSIRDQIHFLNSQSLEFQGVEKRKQNTGAYIGKMMLSDNGNVMWSAHLGGAILSAWNAHECTHMTDVDVGACAKEKCHIDDLQDRIITAMCTALDTVWIGLSSGYIMVFAMNPPGELLTYFRPYNSFVQFLSASKYPGPCQKEECMMLCSGKMYRPDDSFKELPDYARKDENGEPVDTSGVVVLWEVLPAKYTRQVHYLSEGTSWLNYSTLEKSMNDTGFNQRLSTLPPLLPHKIIHLATDNKSGNTFNHQQDSVPHQNTTEDIIM